MTARAFGTPVAVALATVGELARPLRIRPDAERRASRIAVRRAIRGLAGDGVRIELRHRPRCAPLARVRGEASEATSLARSLALSLTHRDGRTAAIAAPAGTRVGIDIERLDAVAPGHERFFLTATERERAGRRGSLLWALKEASWKALALDDTVGFHELELDFDADGGLRAVAVRGVRWRAAASITAPWPGYVMATVLLEEER